MLASLKIFKINIPVFIIFEEKSTKKYKQKSKRIYFNMKKFPYFVTFSALLALLTCVSFGYLVSTLIVSANLFQTTQKVEGGQNTYYLLSVYSAKSLEEAESEAKNFSDTNFGLYIYENDDAYHIIASCYKNNNDAELVKSNLKTNGIEAEILKIKKESVVLEGSFSSNEELILKDCLSTTNNIYNDLYDITVSLDTNVTDEVTAKLKINEVYSNFLTTKNNFETLFSANTSSEIANIRENFTKIDEILLDLTNSTQDRNLSAQIKHSYTKLIVEA